MVTLEQIKLRCKRSNELEDDDCWEWDGKLESGKAPVMRDGNKVVQARRVGYILAIGPIGPKRVIVPGSCENPKCVNPHHMAAKSIQQHIRAMAKKGTYRSEAKWRKIAMAKRARSDLTDQDVADIRASDEPTCKLAAKYNKHPSYIRQLRANVWRLDYTANTFAGLFQGLLRQPDPA